MVVEEERGEDVVKRRERRRERRLRRIGVGGGGDGTGRGGGNRTQETYQKVVEIRKSRYVSERL